MSLKKESLGALLAVALSACSVTAPTSPVETEAPMAADALAGEPTEDAGTGAMALLPVLDAAKAPAENLFFSPLSIEQAFGVLSLGASGETRQQLRTVLGRPAPARGLETKKDGVEVRLANALWLSDRWQFQPAFVDAAAARYDATAERLDFTKAEATAGRINSWADRATDGLIPKVIGPEAVDPDGAAFITNALYFDGLWKDPFDSRERAPFLFGDGSEREFLLMRDTFDLGVVERGDWVAVRLPYRNARYAMDVIMPAKRSVMKAAPDTAEIARFAGALDDAKPRRVEVYLPQFEIEYESGLIDPLRAIGLTLPFDKARADLSAMVTPGQRRLFVDKAVHIAKLQVFDTGTRAAAVTVMRIVPTAARMEKIKPYVFRADRPFVVVLRDLERSTPLFVGRIADPQPFSPKVEEPG